MLLLALIQIPLLGCDDSNPTSVQDDRRSEDDDASQDDDDKNDDNPTDNTDTGEGNAEVQFLPWITRTPRIAPPIDLDESQGSGWPDHGQVVTWEAQIFNHTEDSLTNVSFEWFVDGISKKTIVATLHAGINTISFDWPWNAEPEDISFHLDTAIDAAISAHDAVTIRSNALTVGFWVEQRIVDHLANDLLKLNINDWAQAAVRRWSKMLEKAGVKDRLRLDRLEIIPNGSDYPDNIDTDLWWVFRDDDPDFRFMTSTSDPGTIRDQTIVLHEILHHRGLIDIYAYEIMHDTPNQSFVNILDPNGALAAGSSRMPYVGPRKSFYYPDYMNVLMGHSYHQLTTVSSHSVYGLNQYYGRRTPRYEDQFGNQRNPLSGGNLYMTHVPDVIEVEVSSPDGSLLIDTEIDVFLDHGDHSYIDIYREQPDFVLRTNNSGMVTLSGDIWQDESWTKRDDANVLILRARADADSKWGYTYLSTYHLNLAFQEGQTSSARFQVEIDLQ